MKRLTLSSKYNFSSGYGEILDVLISDLNGFGYDVIPRTYSEISEKYLPLFNKPHLFDSNLLDLSVLSLSNDVSLQNVLTHMSFDRPRVLLTMWESTRINDLIIEILNKFNHIIVPNEYNRYNLLNQGLNTNISVVPLFCDTDIYVYRDHLHTDKFVFGISNEDPRKNLNKIIKCFIKAFSGMKDVELQIKTCKPLNDKIIDSRLKYISIKYTKEQLRDWYHGLDVYVSGATCEGWGMMQQESLCCGRPIIYTHYGGLCEFVNNEIAFEVNYDEVYSKFCWGDYGGKWSDFKEEDMIKKMLYCYNNREIVVDKGRKASESAKIYSKQFFLNNLTKVIDLYI